MLNTCRLEQKSRGYPLSAVGAAAGTSSSSDSGSPDNRGNHGNRGRRGELSVPKRRRWRSAKSALFSMPSASEMAGDSSGLPAAASASKATGAAALLVVGGDTCSGSRYSPVPMRAFLADKDWHQLSVRLDNGKLAKCRLSADKYSRMLYSYHRLYQEYQYICACLLPQVSRQQQMDQFDAGVESHNLSAEFGTLNSNVILPDRNFRLRTCRKRRSIVCNQMLTRSEYGSSVWLSVPIVVELLLPRLQEQIQTIVCACPHISDPLEVLAELRAQRYDTERCIKYLRQTLPLRTVVRDVLSVRSAPGRHNNNSTSGAAAAAAGVIGDNGNANSIAVASSMVAAARGTAAPAIQAGADSGEPAEAEAGGRPLLRGVKRLRADLQVVRASLASVSAAMAAGLGKIRCHLTAQQEQVKRQLQQQQPQQQQQQQQQEQSAALSRMQKCLEELRQKCREEESRRRLAFNALQEQLGNIRVYCRCTKVEGDQSVEPVTQEQVRVRSQLHSQQLTSHQQGQQQIPQQEEVFRFDRVFGTDAPQEALFEELRPLITSFLDGYNVCFITYGSEASGKTFTLLGSANQRGLVYRALLAVLHETASRAADWSTELDTACLEIYNDACFDLLSERQPVSLYKDCSLASAFAALRLAPIREVADINQLLRACSARRRVAKTALNPRSSRSHLIHLVRLQARSRVHGHTTCSYLGMMDLAGAENIVKADTWREPERTAEAGHINRSLAAFNRLFLTLRRTPPSAACYREARLTQMLKPFLVNHGKCCIIVTVRTDAGSTSGSLSTLRFGRDARQVALGKAQRQLLVANVD